jgi:hypothetical protein
MQLFNPTIAQQSIFIVQNEPIPYKRQRVFKRKPLKTRSLHFRNSINGLEEAKKLVFDHQSGTKYLAVLANFDNIDAFGYIL